MRYRADEVLARFAAWYAEAAAHPAIADASACCLATADARGVPSARMVLLKSFDARGFVFYTNMESRKSRELGTNPHAALCFHWPPLERQLRIEGGVERVSDAEADAYFASRPRESRLGAWASMQSETLPSEEALTQAYAEMERRYEGADIPRPGIWSGFRILPARIEFWSQAPHRLHRRECFERASQGEWRARLLYP